MLKPLRGSESVDPFFVVCDIENWPNGDVIAIDTAWREYDDIKHHTCDNWNQWWTFIVENARRNSKWRIIYAHNGCSWDWLSLVYWLVNQEDRLSQSMTGIMAGSKLIALSIKIDKECTINLVDSINLLKGGLDTLGKTFVGKGKIDTGEKLPHQIYRESKDRFNLYLLQDTELLLLVMERVFSLVREKISPIDSFGITIASTALRIFKTSYLDREIDIPWNDKIKDFLREGYHGGRVEVFKPGKYDKIYVYDINSLYPYVMKNFQVPITGNGGHTNIFQPDKCGLYRIRFNQNNRDILPVLMVNGDGAYEGDGVYFEPEISLLKQVDKRADIDILDGFVFDEQDYLFTDYVNTLYSLRMQDKNGPMGEITKLLLNSLYGKFGQKGEREKIVWCRDFDQLESLCNGNATINPLSDEYGLWRITEQTECNFEHVGIAGTITSQARVQLYKGFCNVGHKNIVYCDTDSIHCVIPMVEDMVGSKLGQYKLEFKGEGIYTGKKQYALRNDAISKIRVKGVRINKVGTPDSRKLGTDLAFDDLSDILDGSERLTTFKAAATFKEVCKGKKPCSFEGIVNTRKRTIRKTANDRARN